MLLRSRLAKGGTIFLKVIKYLKKGWVRGIRLSFCMLFSGRANDWIEQNRTTTGPTYFLCSHSAHEDVTYSIVK